MNSEHRFSLLRARRLLVLLVKRKPILTYVAISLITVTMVTFSYPVSCYIPRRNEVLLQTVSWSSRVKTGSNKHTTPIIKRQNLSKLHGWGLNATRTAAPNQLSKRKAKIDASKSLPRSQRTSDRNALKAITPLITVNEMRSELTMSHTETVAMSVAGSALIVCVLLTLGGTGDVEVIGVCENGIDIEALEFVSSNIIDAAVPMTVSDVVAVAIGEAIAGVIGALVSFVLSLGMRWNDNGLIRKGTNQRFSEAVADGDFLLTQAAVIPLFEGIGLTAFTASAASVLFAMVPFSLVKFGARRKQQLLDEERLLEKILKEQLENEEQERRRKSLYSFRFNFEDELLQPNTSLVKKSVDLNNLQPIQSEMGLPDLVETFTDIAKWLQYSILMSEYSGALFSKSDRIFPGEEGAIFGSIATISSQFYSDILYGYFGLGGDDKREIIRSRRLADWSGLYLYKAAYAAALFGVYESVKAPARFFVNALLSGGVDNCYGSADLKACIDTYVSMNPPGATLEAQLRGLFTAAYSFWYNYVITASPFS